MLLLYIFGIFVIINPSVLSLSIPWGRQGPRRPWHFQADEIQEPRRKCRESVDLSREFMDWFKESQSDPQILAHLNDESSFNSAELELQDLKTEPANCEDMPSTGVDSTVMERALCPWEWRLNRNENREPKLISEARCLCRRARGSIDALCVPIEREFPVLNRIECDEGGKFEYVRSFETITVGCHSVVPRRQRALPLSHHLGASNEVKR